MRADRVRIPVLLSVLPLAALAAGWFSGPAATAQAADLVFKTVMVQDDDENPAAAGKRAAEALKKAMDGAPLKAVILSECFEDRENKEKLLEGVTSVLPKETVFGAATYGSFTQEGCTDADSVCLLGIGGDGLQVRAALATEMGTAALMPDKDRDEIEKRLHAAGQKLAREIARTDKDRLLVLLADAHSPKNQFLVEGLQKVLGGGFPITGGCANKNAGQTFVYYRGQARADSAIALMLSGDFQVSLAGRQANENEKVIATAGEGAAAAVKASAGKPVAVLAFNCAGRRGKLKSYQDELDAMRKPLGGELPLFGCYCAGEMGPLDVPDKKPGVLCGGSGWHVMFTVISK